MKKTFIIIGIVLILGYIGSVIAMGGSDTETSKTNDKTMSGMENTSSDTMSEEQPAANEVFMQDFAFTPAEMTVKKGTTVTWTNKDDAKHDVAPDQESESFKSSPNLLAKGESYSFTFNTVGTYSYHCTPHPYMKATVEVTE